MAMLSAASYLGTITRLAARGLRARGKEYKLPKERVVLERRGIRISPRQLARYLKVTAGSSIPGFHEPEAVLPPLYPAVWETALAMELLTDPRVPAAPRGVLHLESDSMPLRPLRPGDTIRCRLELERATRDPQGICLHLVTRNWNGAGLLCSENRTVLLLRGVAVAGVLEPAPDSNPESGRAAKGVEVDERVAQEEDTLGDWEEIARWSLRGSHGRRYARASGDYNPIHLWSWTARPFGFRRAILHGYCLEALVAHTLIAHRWEGDPIRLRRLRIHFRAPLLLPDRVALLVAETAEEASFRVVGMEGRREGRIYAQGSFTGG